MVIAKVNLCFILNLLERILKQCLGMIIESTYQKVYLQNYGKVTLSYILLLTWYRHLCKKNVWEFSNLKVAESKPDICSAKLPIDF